MIRRIRLTAFVLMAALLITGCSLNGVQDLYSPPRRPEDANHLQSAIDEAMTGLTNCAPVSGDNRQTLQQADLTGDGVEEYILFAKGMAEKPLRVLIFGKDAGDYQLLDVIEVYGTAFEQVEYVDLDGEAGLEMVLGSRMNDHVFRSVTVYGFSSGFSQRMRENYHKLLTCDLNSDGIGELLLFKSDQQVASASLYAAENGVLQRTAEISLFDSIDNIDSITASYLANTKPAVYIAGRMDDNTILQILTVNNGAFTTFTFKNLSNDGQLTDIDSDGIPELPEKLQMRRLGTQRLDMTRWFAVDGNGQQVDKCYTFHQTEQGWYLMLPMEWILYLSASQGEDGYTFYVWNESFTNYEQIFSIHILTDENREEEAQISNRFVLYRTEDLVCVARLEAASAAYGITQESLTNSFHLIRMDWNTGET